MTEKHFVLNIWIVCMCWDAEITVTTLKIIRDAINLIHLANDVWCVKIVMDPYANQNPRVDFSPEFINGLERQLPLVGLDILQELELKLR